MTAPGVVIEPGVQTARIVIPAAGGITEFDVQLSAAAFQAEPSISPKMRLGVSQSNLHWTLSIQGRSRMKVADRDGQSVGSVHGLGGGSEFEQARNHVLYLLFLGPAITNHGRFDGKRGIFRDLKSRSGGGQHGNAANLAQLQRGLDVQRVKHIFDGDLIGLMARDDFSQLGEDPGQTLRQRLSEGQLNRAAGEAA
jgi:hypothetical protein